MITHEDFERAKDLYNFWERHHGEREAHDWALKTIAGQWHEIRELKRMLAAARRQNTMLRKRLEEK